MTLEQARKAVQKDYPNQEIGLGFEFEGAWYFRVGGVEDGGIHAVDNKTGFVTGNLPIMILVQDEKFMAALKKASGVKKNDLGASDGAIEHNGIRSWREESFLEHHGIIGMHWGERRYQYKNGRYTPEGKIRYAKKNGNSSELSGDDAKDGIAVETVLAAAYLSTVAVTTATALTTMAVESHNEKMGDKLLDKKKIADTSKQFSNDNPPKKIEGEHTAEDDMAKVNEAYGILRPQTQNNCSHCSITMELRRRGFDVCARTSSEPVYTHLQLEKAFKEKVPIESAAWDKPKNWDKLSNQEKTDSFNRAKMDKKVATNFKEVESNILKKYPEGARGLFSAICPYTMTGHAMAFEVKGGKVVIYDTQTNRKFNLSSAPASFSSNFAPVSASCYRLDNKTINWDGMNSICAERIKG